MAFGAASGYVTTGTWRGAVPGAFTAGLTFGVGWAAHVYQWGDAARVIAQSMTGGVIEMLQGGNFGNGFVTAGLTAAAMPHVGRINSNIGRTTLGALVGGTISKATGGKFANGALSGAIQAAMSHRGVARDSKADGERPSLAKANAAVSEAYTALENHGLLEKVYSGDGALQAAIEDWGELIGPIARKYDVEISALIYDLGGSYVLAGPHSDGYRTMVMPRSGPRLDPSYKGRLAGFVHTHPDSASLSSGDMGLAYDMSQHSGVTAYAIAVLNGKPVSVWSSMTRREIPWEDF